MALYINKPIPKFSPMAIDLETSGLDPYQDRLLSVAVSDGKDTWILLDFFGFDYILDHLADPDIVKIAHKADFEHRWFKHLFDIEVNNWFDTMLTERVLSTSPVPIKGFAALDETLKRYLPGVELSKDTRKTFEDHSGFAFRPVTHEQLVYMRDDVLYLNSLREKQLKYIQDMGLERTVQLEVDIIPAIVELEMSGVSMDVDLWFEIENEFRQLVTERDKQMRDILGKKYIAHVPGMKDKKPVIREIAVDDLNFNSVPQLKEIFKDVFGIQTYTTDKEFLKSIIEQRPETPAAKFCEAMLDKRFCTKQIGYAYHEHIHPITGKIHPEYHQLGARTGRFSCSNPNMQQVLRPSKDKPNVRHIFVADTEDHVIVRADYAQQEVRVMAELCGDPDMIKACNAEDVYIEFGRHIFGHEIEKGSPERHTAKTFVLATGYGAGGERLSNASGKDVATCLNVREMIRSKFPIMATFGNRMYTMYRQYGYVQTAIGRRRYIDDMFTKAVNTPVQGTSADMFKLALAKIYKRLTELKKCGKIDSNTRVWNIVHDEIEVHCHKDEVDFILPIIKELMEEAGNELCPNVKHIAEAEYAYRWDK